MDIIEDIALRFALALLCAGSVAGMLLALGLLLRSEWIVRLNRYLSQWRNADNVTEKLDRQRPTARFVCAQHVGAVADAWRVELLALSTQRVPDRFRQRPGRRSSNFT